MNYLRALYDGSVDNDAMLKNRKSKITFQAKLFSPAIFQLFADCLSLITSYAIFTIVRYYFGAYDISFELNFINIFVIPVTLSSYFLPIFWMAGLYGDWFIRSPFDELFAIARTTFWGCFAIFILIVIDSSNFHKYRLKIIAFWLIFTTTVFTFRILSRLLQRYLRRRGLIVMPAIIVGSSQRVISLMRWIRGNRSWGYDVRCIALDGGELPLEYGLLSKVTTSDKYEEIIREINPQVVLISTDNINHDRLLNITSFCAERGVRVKIVPDLYEIFTGLARAVPMYGAPLIEVTTTILRPWQETVKRLIDIVFSSLVIVLGSPLWIFIAVAIRIESKGNVLFSHTRIGKNGKPFLMYKFRSMINDAEASGQQWTIVNDPRVTKFGKILRKSHIDEIPQFWNVLKGDMSIVGPRPEQSKFVEKYSELIPYYKRRLIVRPGITGWWQVKYKPYSETVQEVESRLIDDFYYIENLSLKLDFEILIRTIYCVISGHGQS